MTCTAAQTGFAEAAGPWRSLLERKTWTSVFLTPEWQETWWEQFGGDGWELRLLTVGPKDAPAGLAPMASKEGTLAFLGDTDLFDYHDFIDGSPEFYETLVNCLEDEPWETLDLRSIPEFSPTLPHLLDAYRAKGYSVSVEPEDVVPGAALPATWEEYLAVCGRRTAMSCGASCGGWRPQGTCASCSQTMPRWRGISMRSWT